jgi:hypothetical protein
VQVCHLDSVRPVARQGRAASSRCRRSRFVRVASRSSWRLNDQNARRPNLASIPGDLAELTDAFFRMGPSYAPEPRALAADDEPTSAPRYGGTGELRRPIPDSIKRTQTTSRTRSRSHGIIASESRTGRSCVVGLEWVVAALQDVRGPSADGLSLGQAEFRYSTLEVRDERNVDEASHGDSCVPLRRLTASFLAPIELDRRVGERSRSAGLRSSHRRDRREDDG